jgi:V/A-type H+/Na+-transporting ATPase subunit I
MFTGKMLYMQMVVLERDFEKTIDLLGDFGWVEIKRSESERKEKFIKMYEIVEDVEKKMGDITDFFGLHHTLENGQLRELDGISDYFKELHSVILPYKEKYAELIKRKKSLENDLKDSDQFKNLNITRGELEKFSFYHYTAGGLTAENAEKLKEILKDRVEVIKLEEEFYLIFTSRKGRWSLESELKKLDFKEKKLAGEEDIIPTEIYKRVLKDIEDVDKEIQSIEQYKENYMKQYGKDLIAFIHSFNLQKIYQGVYQQIEHSESVTLIEGWILQKKVPVLNNKLKEKLGAQYSIITYNPDELEDVKNGSLKIPVLLENNKFFKPFEMLLFSYGTPTYRSFDPTKIFTLTFLLFFGMMFGDMGQGFIILAGGLFLRAKTKMKDFGFILSWLGIISMIFGFLYGSAFCFERDQLAGILTPVNHALFGINGPSLIAINMDNSSKIFLIVIGIGFFMNLFGMLLNVVNGIVKGKTVETLFAPTGFAGFLLGMSVVVFVIPMALPTFGINVVYPAYATPAIITVAIVSLVMIFYQHQLVNLIRGHRPLYHDGFIFGTFFSCIEIFEVLLNTLSNNISFIRLAAFAFSHMILSTVIMDFAVSSPGGILSPVGIFVLIIGNVIVLVLEGLIACIQAIRLEYYEFFSKFFGEFGRQFVPFKIEKSKVGE